MKKTLILLCLISLFAIVALPVAHAVEACTVVVPCVVDTITYTDCEVVCEFPGRIYVWLSVQDASNAYTASVHVCKPNRQLIAQKWVTPELKTPIQSSQFIVGQTYGIAIRSNTRYYEFDGLTSVTYRVQCSAR